MKRQKTQVQKGVQLEEGFQNQVMYVIPLPVIQNESKHPLVRALYATALGYFPEARHHYRERAKGSTEHILIVCAAGEGWVEIENKRRLIKPRQALLIPRGLPHLYGASSDNPWTIYWSHLAGDEADYYLACLPPKDYVLPLSMSCERDLVALFTSAYGAIEREYSEATIIHLSQIMRHLMSQLFFHNRAYSAIHRASMTRNLRDTVTYIILHCNEPLTLEDLAHQAKLSVRSFTRLFHQQTGIAPMQYVIQQRMRCACKLLVDASFTICEIGLQVGYEDPCYFSRLFCKEIGLSPRDYRYKHSPQAEPIIQG